MVKLQQFNSQMSDRFAKKKLSKKIKLAEQQSVQSDFCLLFFFSIHKQNDHHQMKLLLHDVALLYTPLNIMLKTNFRIKFAFKNLFLNDHTKIHSHEKFGVKLFNKKKSRNYWIMNNFFYEVENFSILIKYFKCF